MENNIFTRSYKVWKLLFKSIEASNFEVKVVPL